MLRLYWYIICRHEWKCGCFIISRINWMRVRYTLLEKSKTNCISRLTVTNHTCMHFACVYAHKHVALQVLRKDMTHKTYFFNAVLQTCYHARVTCYCVAYAQKHKISIFRGLVYFSTYDWQLCVFHALNIVCNQVALKRVLCLPYPCVRV